MIKKEQYEELKFNYPNVFELNLDKQRYVLEKTNVSDIWGIWNWIVKLSNKS